MELKDVQKNWDKFGKMDPFWSILTVPEKFGNKWNVDEFFKTGVDEIFGVMNYLKTLDVKLSTRKALDFGCGVGRLTQALAIHFNEVHGIDIAPSMVELARKNNRYQDKCFYHINNGNDIRQFCDNNFDFVYTNIVLQHIKPEYVKEYIKEFLRIMVPGGILIFQMPSSKNSSNKVLDKYKWVLNPKYISLVLAMLCFWRRFPIMEMYCIHKEEMITFLRSCGANLLDTIYDSAAGEGYDSVRYCVSKCISE